MRLWAIMFYKQKYLNYTHALSLHLSVIWLTLLIAFLSFPGIVPSCWRKESREPTQGESAIVHCILIPSSLLYHFYCICSFIYNLPFLLSHFNRLCCKFDLYNIYCPIFRLHLMQTWLKWKTSAMIFIALQVCVFLLRDNNYLLLISCIFYSLLVSRSLCTFRWKLIFDTVAD